MGGEGGVVVARLGLGPAHGGQVRGVAGGEEAQRGRVHAARQVAAQPLSGGGLSARRGLQRGTYGSRTGLQRLPRFRRAPPPRLPDTVPVPDQAVSRRQRDDPVPHGLFAQRRRQNTPARRPYRQGVFVHRGPGHRREQVGPVGCHRGAVQPGVDDPAQAGGGALQTHLSAEGNRQMAGARQARGQAVHVGRRAHLGCQAGQPRGGHRTYPDDRHPYRPGRGRDALVTAPPADQPGAPGRVGHHTWRGDRDSRSRGRSGRCVRQHREPRPPHGFRQRCNRRRRPRRSDRFPACPH